MRVNSLFVLFRQRTHKVKEKKTEILLSHAAVCDHRDEAPATIAGKKEAVHVKLQVEET